MTASHPWCRASGQRDEALPGSWSSPESRNPRRLPNIKEASSPESPFPRVLLFPAFSILSFIGRIGPGVLPGSNQSTNALRMTTRSRQCCRRGRPPYSCAEPH
jgi:hypothetical protein